MARQRSQFRPDTPVLWLDPEPPAHGLAKRHLLWPAWSHLVIAPRVTPGRRTLNIVDEAVLRLLVAGVRSAPELARTLRLDRELVAYVCADLRQRGLCDERDAPAEAGMRALRDRDAREEEPCRGHVFRDPATGALWGRFVERPGYAELTWRDRRPWLVLGPEGRARPVPVLRVPPAREALPAAPSATEVLREVEIHRRAIAGGDARASIRSPAPEQLRRVEVVRAQPDPVWLAVPLYATRVEDDGAPWHACDPFGVGSSPPLRRAIARRAESEPDGPLAALLHELAQEGATRGNARAERARAALTARFGDRLAAVPGLQGALVDMQLAVASGGKGPRAAAVARAQVRRALERLLRPALGGAGEEIMFDLVDDREHDGALIAAHLEALGFEPAPPGAPVPSAAELRAVVDERAAPLRPLFAAIVLAAALDPDHPLRELAARRPAFPSAVDALADVLETSSGAWDANAERAELERLADTALDAVECLIANGAARALEV